jgi:hypothetical protein
LAGLQQPLCHVKSDESRGTRHQYGPIRIQHLLPRGLG